MADPNQETARYPLFSLPSCLNVAEAVRDGGGLNSDVPKSFIASHLKMDEKASILSQRIGAARSYGLIEGRGAYCLTPAGCGFFFPSSESDKRKAGLTFLAAPEVFGRLIQRFDGSKLPALPMLANLIHKEFSVPESWKDRVASFFMRSAEFVGALDGHGFLRYSASSHTMNQSLQSPSVHAAPPSSQPQIEHTAEPDLMGQGKTAWSSTFKGQSVRVEATGELPLALWLKLNAYVQVLKPLEDES